MMIKKVVMIKPFSICFSVSAQKAIEEGKTPAIQIAARDWNDVSRATKIELDAPIKV